MRRIDLDSAALIAVLLALAVLPWVPGIGVTAAGLALAEGVAALGLGLLIGQAGLVSFGHGMFYAAAAYAAAMLLNYAGVREALLLLAVGVAAAALAAAAVGALCVRHRRIYFAMLTFAFGQLFYVLLIKAYNITGGSNGMPFHGYTILGLSLPPDEMSLAAYYLGFAVVAAAALLMHRVYRSTFGLSLRAVRDDEHRAKALGLSPNKLLWLAFLLSGVLAGIGGVIDAMIVGQITPDLTYWTFSGELVFIAVLGGVASVWAPLLGGIVYILAYTYLYTLIPNWWRAALGVVLLGIIAAAAGGIEGLIRRLSSKLLRAG